MQPVSSSGLYGDASAQTFLITQGVEGYTLVAGKQSLVRIFMGSDAVAQVDHIVLTIQPQNAAAGHKTAIIAWRDSLTTSDSWPDGPSAGIILRGYLFPMSGIYAVTMSMRNMAGDELAQRSFDVEYAPTKDLRLLIVPLIGSARNFVVTPAWYADIDRAMKRIGSMYPVRDCVLSHLDHHSASGLRYFIGAPKEAWPDEVGGVPGLDYLDETKQINSQVGAFDRVDVTVYYRPRQAVLGEPPGGNALYCVSQLAQAQCIGGPWNGVEMTAPCFAQETGHTLCLEPQGSPRADPNDLMHSGEAQVFHQFGFDFVNKRPYSLGQPLGDVMGLGSWNGADSVAFSPYDWEYLRAKLTTLNSTGTEANPSRKETCPEGPVAAKPRSVGAWVRVLSGQAGGPVITIGPHGIKVGPPPSPLARQSATRMEALHYALRGLGGARVRDVFVATEGESIPLASGAVRQSPHHPGFEIGNGPGLSFK